MREPLVQFSVLGAALFGIHHLLAAQLSPEPRIALDAHKRAELVALFEQRQQRAPSTAETAALEQSWLEDEVLLREADRLDLVHQDQELRDQLIARMRSLLQASSAPPAPDERALRAYYTAYAASYREPAALTFSEHFVAKGPSAEERARSLLQGLRTGEPVLEQPLVHNARPEPELARLYDEDLVRKMRSAPLETWHIVRSTRGVHVIRLTARVPERDPSFAELRPRLLADLAAEQERAQFREHLRDLIARWQGPEQP